MTPKLPGSSVGIVGGGQLGRMLAAEARRMGYRVQVFDPAPDSPAAALADRHWCRPFSDREALEEFARAADVITYEFENIPAESLTFLEERKPVSPSPEILRICQDRFLEKDFLVRQRCPVAAFARVESADDLEKALGIVGTPALFKTARLGYDGRGQAEVRTPADLEPAWRRLGGAPAILEKEVRLEAELSAIVGRSAAGDLAVFPISRNFHREGIFDYSLTPSGLGKRIEAAAKEMAVAIASALRLVGVLAVEFFLDEGGGLLVNELAPRPHNSGHFTLDGCRTSQFEQQLRAVAGLPLGDVSLRGPILVRNILGDAWSQGEPDWAALLSLPGLRLHLYGKSRPAPKRKMGHYAVVAASMAEACALDRRALAVLRR
ncbi:N5-carboxyaminoimidazole ribonucleotide synthase [Methylacidimicrobium sp. AP8]|uniref:5-(carboxyamino)imidazole ribonucleotide synthase n=1 Tax=Methylacidimicrobium sp. AP8 TaxID=2730359 RepID=UPI0018C0DF03|nr:5-(carboxyamino)imidazole ribonucleotide synthase [Methylacidimicrobium sp. AP8]CAB4242602.1 N5-carboxyaminoimidazole ribonucleotide synthase [Methylacidimicrobium sp. AP8]